MAKMYIVELSYQHIYMHFPHKFNSGQEIRVTLMPRIPDFWLYTVLDYCTGFIITIKICLFRRFEDLLRQDTVRRQ